jgi:hypothetical protein
VHARAGLRPRFRQLFAIARAACHEIDTALEHGVIASNRSRACSSSPPARGCARPLHYPRRSASTCC